jgi:hypothetical protein
MTEQEEKVFTALKHYHPSIVSIAGVYNDQFPAATTPPAVVDAVTVAVPLRVFMVMAATCTKVLADDAAQAPAAEPTA